MIETTPQKPTPPVEMWGGIECSYVRVAGEARDQLRLNGHATRLQDLDRFAALGIRALRYPVLWEHHADPARIDWSWADERLTRLRELGIRPIIGFVHHGSGPLPGGLVDPGFVSGLAAFARAVAERFPWVDAYTPVNEPATTARFSGLYGLWHPHGRDVACFGRCFVNECLGTRAAMKAIREVNPRAQLIQTEDLGKTHSTPRLAYQAAYENERRWLTYDILCGRVDPSHPVHRHLLDSGIPAAELASFVDDPCIPDVFGMNYYVTSERLLDERLHRYPAHTHGGNGREAYADVDAVRVRAEGLVGVGGLLREMWERYQRPVAITEVQLACTREEQVRWLVETWQLARSARATGVDVRAITPWALLGSFDWDSLLVHVRGSYETGAFDVRGPLPRRTAVAAAIAGLARDGEYHHPVLESPGWWKRPVRLVYPAVSAPATGPGTAHREERRSQAAPMVVLGAGGRLGRVFLDLCAIRGLHVVGLRRTDVDIGSAPAVRAALDELRPWAVINCAGYVHIDSAERQPAECRRANVDGASNVAAACAERGAQLATFSTDLVFDGAVARAYVERDVPNPLNCYGRSKHDAEQRIAQLHPGALIVRTSACFGPSDDRNFAARVLRTLAAAEVVRATADHQISPTYVPDLVNATLDLLIDGEHGVWHLANQGSVSWFDWARALAEIARLRADHVICASPVELGWVALRPSFSALASTRGNLLPTWQSAIERFVAATPDLRAQAAA